MAAGKKSEFFETAEQTEPAIKSQAQTFESPAKEETVEEEPAEIAWPSKQEAERVAPTPKVNPIE